MTPYTPDTRGQTQQDFAVGAGIFLLAVFFVFGFVPTTIAPSGAATEAASYAADRATIEIADDVGRAGEANTLDRNRTQTFFTENDDPGDIKQRYDLRNATQVNVTLETLQGVTVDLDGAPARAGSVYAGGVGVSTATVLRFDGQRYRLVVRVW